MSSKEETRRGCCGGGDANPNCCCSRVEWAMWGNLNSLYAAALLFIGGVVGATVDTIRLDDRFGPGIAPHSWGFVTRWMVIPISLAIFFVEYPYSARRNRKKKSVERPGQRYVAPLLHITGFFGRNYIIRFLLYLVAIIPALFILSTILGAICLFIGCVCYFIAALNGEEWKAPSLAWGPGSKKKEPEQAGHTLPAAPSHPPPRPPPQHKYYGGTEEGDAPDDPPPRPQAPSQPPPRPRIKA